MIEPQSRAGAKARVRTVQDAPLRGLPVCSELGFRDALRSARRVALEDAEAFAGIVHVIEQLGCQLTGKISGLAGYRNSLIEYGSRSCLAGDGRLAAILEHVRVARNDAVHVGAFARTLTRHAIEASLILEDALTAQVAQVADFMVPNPVCAHGWQTLAAVRQMFLSNSFSWLPIKTEGGWRLLSDFAIAKHLRSGPSSRERAQRLAQRLEDIIDELDAEVALTCSKDGVLSDVVGLIGPRPLLVVEPDGTLIGIITAYDFL